jgi:hypothetical protein
MLLDPVLVLLMEARQLLLDVMIWEEGELESGMS